MRQAIPARVKLVVTVRYLSTGESYQSLHYQYRIHKGTLCLFIPKVCLAIYRNLKDTYMQVIKFLVNIFLRTYINTKYCHN